MHQTLSHNFGMLSNRALRRSGHRVAAQHVRPIMASAVGFGKPASSVPKDLQTPKQIPTVTKLEWPKPLTILKYPDPRLRAPNAKVEVFDDSLMQLVKEMIPVMYQDDGVGLAAPQVGVNIRLMIFNPYGRERPGHERVLVNPEVVAVNGPRVGMEEGCLSFPKIFAEVERPRDITIRAQDEKGQPVQLTLGGTAEEDMWISRIFQHEFDHLQGILFPDRMKGAVLDKVRTQLVALEDTFATANPGVAIQRLKPSAKAKGFGAK